MSRVGEITRETSETKVEVRWSLDDVGQVAGVDDDRFGGHGANPAIAQEPVDRRNITQWPCALFHTHP